MISQLKTVLIVDDNPVLLSVLAEILKECGFDTRKADSGFAALAEISGHIPDLLISDLDMPRMSGSELLSIVRNRFPEVTVIAMSALYSGSKLPAGVAADAFYAKGDSSVAHLLDIVCGIKGSQGRSRGASQQELHSFRSDQCGFPHISEGLSTAVGWTDSFASVE